MNMKKIDTIYEIRDNYLFLKVKGYFDVTRSKKIIYETGEELRTHNLNKIFCDFTEVTGFREKEKSVIEIYDLSSVILHFLPKGTRIFVLGTKEQIGKESFLEVSMINSGFPTKVTTNPEEGLKWLGMSKEIINKENKEKFSTGDKVKDGQGKTFIIHNQLGNEVTVENEGCLYHYYPEELTKI